MLDDSTESPADEPEEPAEEPAPLLELRDPLPPVIESQAALEEASDALAAAGGPVAIDAERASGYRYSARAYLIQLRRDGAGTHLVDPTAVDDLQPLVAALEGTEWILHAATQDLPCLTALGLYPVRLFDTELAGRLLGYPRVGLGTLVETVLGYRMAKEHSAADWSTRPLPEPWLVYAALDVELLLELKAALEQQLVEAGKDEWARQEFEYLRGFELQPRTDAWRRTSGMHKVRGRRGLGVVRALWELRDEIAEQRDVTPGRIIPDSAIVAAAIAMPSGRSALLRTQGFHGRGATRYAGRFAEAIAEVATLDEKDLPARTLRGDGPPPPRAWADRDPVAARRLTYARERVAQMSEELSVPVENLLSPDSLRRVLWTPPTTREPAGLAEAVDDQLTALQARAWQRQLVGPVLVEAILGADQPTT